MKDLKVSVIVTTYNQPSYLKKVLEGLDFQERLPDEVIVADDGSGQETEDVIKDFTEVVSFPVIHVWHEDKGFRLSKIRNEAIKKASSEYLIMMDGDCITDRHFVYDHLSLAEKGFFIQGKRALLKEKASLLFTAEDANSSSRLLRLIITNSLSNAHHILRIPSFPSIRSTRLKGIKGCNMGFFKDDLIAVNGYNEAFESWGREDTELAIRLYRYGLKRKEHLFRAICYHLWHPSHQKEEISVNDRILEETLKGNDYRCKNGIIKI